ncbi:MAG: hypothetical protein JNN10_09340 [Sphingopyxis sp.]|uniref:hypothetical protein n=1 Tax=Sphingopyxis sp. TaxID=1908224 RepID=UPI001A557BD5|nr:hypothetical protein [Sphingopyxis sp.]MBL9066482.1 hypothetical protein [Sphingopyxis sp.]
MSISETAWALFDAHKSGIAPLSRKGGSFVGQLAVDPPSALTASQADWLTKLVDRAGLRSMGGETND